MTDPERTRTPGAPCRYADPEPRESMGDRVLLLGGVLSIGAAVPLVWWARRRMRPSPSRRIAGIAGAAIIVVGAGAVAVHVWALTSTDTSQFARGLLWGGSAFGDQDRFPARTMRASTDPLMFGPVADSPVSDFTGIGSAVSIEEFLESSDTTAFIVVRGDALLYEGYSNGSSHDATQTSFSVAKSFIATLVGIAIDEGHIGSLDDAVTVYVPELAETDERHADISLRHLITMSSGLSFDEGGGPWDDPANTYHGTNL